MPASDYDARALALPLEDEESGQSPIWSRRSPQSFRRPTTTPTWKQRALSQCSSLARRISAQYAKLSVTQKILFIVGNIVMATLAILFLIYNEKIFAKLLPAAKKWRDVPGGWCILWVAIVVVSFPPLIGYSSLLTICGFVYGFPNGWFIAATATIAGSTASFLLSRSILKSLVHRLIANDTRFAALALTMKHDGLKLLVMIRMCPLPYSLTNGAIATFPTVHWASFALANAIVSPKLMLHIYIGAQFEKLADSDGKMDPGTKALSYFSIAIGAIAGVATGWFMYRKTKQRAAQLEAEERAGIRRTSIEDLENEYVDDPGALEPAARLREDDDDISLRSGWDDDVYSDEPPETGDAVAFTFDFFLAYVQRAHDALIKLRGKAWEETGVRVLGVEGFQGLWPYKFNQIPYLGFTEGFHIPEKLLHGPWTEDKASLLYVLVGLNGEIDWKDSMAGETAKTGIKEALREGNEYAVAALSVLLGIAKAITTDILRYAVIHCDCPINMLRHLLFNAQILGHHMSGEILDFYDPKLWAWADANGEKGDVLKGMLKNADGFALEFFFEEDPDWMKIVSFPYGGSKFDIRTTFNDMVRELLEKLYQNHGRRITMPTRLRSQQVVGENA